MGDPFKISPLRKNWKSNSSPWLWQKQKTGEQPTLVPLLLVYSAELSPKAKTKGLEAPRGKGGWLAYTASSLMGQNMASTTKGQNNCHLLYLSVQLQFESVPLSAQLPLTGSVWGLSFISWKTWTHDSPMLISNMLNLKAKITGSSTDKIWNNAWGLRKERVKVGY